MARHTRRFLYRVSRRIRGAVAYVLILAASLATFLAILHSCSTPPDLLEDTPAPRAEAQLE